MLNPVICAMFMFQGFQQETVRLTKVAVSYSNTHPSRDESFIRESLAGGELECAEWFRTFAELVCSVCNDAYIAADKPGIWYYDIAEWLGSEVACRASMNEVNMDELVALSVTLTEKWDDMECANHETARQYVLDRLCSLNMPVIDDASPTQGTAAWRTENGCFVELTQRVGFIHTLTAVSADRSVLLIHENLLCTNDNTSAYSLI